MQRFLYLLLPSIFLSAVPARADDDLVETVNVSTTSQVNANDLDPGTEYSLQCSVATTYRTCPTSSCTALSTDYQLPAAPSGTTVILRSGRARIAFKGTGSGTCGIFLSSPRDVPVYR